MTTIVTAQCKLAVDVRWWFHHHHLIIRLPCQPLSIQLTNKGQHQRTWCSMGSVWLLEEQINSKQSHLTELPTRQVNLLCLDRSIARSIGWMNEWNRRRDRPKLVDWPNQIQLKMAKTQSEEEEEEPAYQMNSIQWDSRELVRLTPNKSTQSAATWCVQTQETRRNQPSWSVRAYVCFFLLRLFNYLIHPVSSEWLSEPEKASEEPMQSDKAATNTSLSSSEASWPGRQASDNQLASYLICFAHQWLCSNDLHRQHYHRGFCSLRVACSRMKLVWWLTAGAN